MKRLAVALSACASLLSACISLAGAPLPETPTPSSTFTHAPTYTPSPTVTVCADVLHPPWLAAVTPNPLAASQEFLLEGSGGYTTNSCFGGWDESARAFDLWLDGKPFDSIVCRVNYCRGNFILPPDTPPGTHCLSTDPGACQIEFQTTGN